MQQLAAVGLFHNDPGEFGDTLAPLSFDEKKSRNQDQDDLGQHVGLSRSAMDALLASPAFNGFAAHSGRS